MTDRYAVIGNPVAHSKSPQIHALFAEQAGQDMRYEAMLAPSDGFGQTVRDFIAQGGRGMNVTVPFKFDAFNIATELTERARAAQAVNTLKFDNGAILGDNTDGTGLVRDIRENLGFHLNDRRVLLMGAGGAAYGVVLPLLAAGANLTVANRTAAKAQQLAVAFAGRGNITASGYEDLRGQQFDAVINATSSSLSDEMPPLPDGIFSADALAYDMMYGRETPFMAFAREHGAAIVADGLGMLVEQAAESFFLWRGVRPETAPVIAVLRDR